MPAFLCAFLRAGKIVSKPKSRKKIPDFSKCSRLPIIDFGAVAGDKEKTTQAIVKAIEAANKMGGEVVGI